MSVAITVDIFCDECGAWDGMTNGVHGGNGGHTPAAIRASLRAKGWSRRHDERGRMIDLCPACWRPPYPPAGSVNGHGRRDD